MKLSYVIFLTIGITVFTVSILELMRLVENPVLVERRAHECVKEVIDFKQERGFVSFTVRQSTPGAHCFVQATEFKKNEVTGLAESHVTAGCSTVDHRPVQQWFVLSATDGGTSD